MRDVPRESRPSTLPATSKSQTESDVVNCARFFEEILSTDAQKRHGAEVELATIPDHIKPQFLWRSFKLTTNDQHRCHSLSLLCSQLENKWRQSFPQSQNGAHLDPFCHELLSEVQNETNVTRETLAFLIATVARKRLNDTGGVQDWAELIDYMEESPKSASDHHTIVSLSILMHHPRVFADNTEACAAFFKNAISSDHRSVGRELIKSYVAVKATSEEPLQVTPGQDEIWPDLATMIEENYAAEKEIDPNARNELALVLINECLFNNVMNVKIVGLEMLTQMRKSLDMSCLAAVKDLIECCLTGPERTRPFALIAYANVIMQEGNDASPLANLLPSIVSMCEEDPIVEEERRRNDDDEMRFTPLWCISRLTEKADSCRLLLPHLQTIVSLCSREIALTPSESLERAHSFLILHGLLKYHWDAVNILFGRAYLPGLARSVIACPLEEKVSAVASKLIALFANHDSTADQVVHMLMQQSTPDTHLKQAALRIIQTMPRAFDATTKTVLEKYLTDAAEDIRVSALHAFTAIAKSMASDGSTAEATLGASVLLIVQMCDRNSASERETIACLETLSELITTLPSLVEPMISAIIALCCKLTLNNNALAMDIIYQLCEKSSELIKTKCEQQIDSIIESTLLMAANGDATDDWLAGEEPDLCDETGDKIYRMIEALGYEIMPSFISVSRKLESNANWRQRYMSILALFVDCSHNFNPQYMSIEQLAATLVRATNDVHPQVRNAARSALHRLSTQKPPILQEKCHKTVIPALISMVKEIDKPRLAAQCCITLCMFIDNIPKDSTIKLEATLLEIVAHLQTNYLAMMHSTHELLLETIYIIDSVALVEPLVIYTCYEDVMGPLRAILMERPCGEMLTDVIRAIGCVGVAAGRTQALDDALQVMFFLTREMESLLSQKKSKGLALVIRLIGADSSRFLPTLVPQLIAACKAYEDGCKDGATIDKIRTRCHAARNTLLCLAAELGATFEPYVNVVKSLALANLRSKDVTWGADIYPHLLKSVMQGGQRDELLSLWTDYWSIMNQLLLGDVCSITILKSITESIEECGPMGIPDEAADTVRVSMENHIGWMILKELTYADLDTDEDIEAKKWALHELLHIINSGLKCLGASFVPIANQYMPLLLPVIDVKDDEKGIDLVEKINQLVFDLSLKPR